MKFCMHRPGKTNNNPTHFNPTIFWRGVHQLPLPPTSVNPTHIIKENIFGQLTPNQDNFNPTIFWGEGGWLINTLGLIPPFFFNISKKLKQPNTILAQLFYGGNGHEPSPEG